MNDTTTWDAYLTQVRAELTAERDRAQKRLLWYARSYGRTKGTLEAIVMSLAFAHEREDIRTRVEALLKQLEREEKEVL